LLLITFDHFHPIRVTGPWPRQLPLCHRVFFLKKRLAFAVHTAVLRDSDSEVLLVSILPLNRPLSTRRWLASKFRDARPVFIGAEQAKHDAIISDENYSPPAALD